MKTLKEAYESVGEKIQVGDRLGEYMKIKWVDGWFFDVRTYSGDYYTVLDSSRYYIGEIGLPIRRNGKQIYPAIEEVRTATTEEYRLYRAFLRDGAIRNINNIVEHLSALIDAKIKESKCNS